MGHRWRWLLALAVVAVLAGANAGRAQRPEDRGPVGEGRAGHEFLKLGNRFVRKDQIAEVEVTTYDRGDNNLTVFLVGRPNAVGGAWVKGEDGQALIRERNLPAIPAKAVR